MSTAKVYKDFVGSLSQRAEAACCYSWPDQLGFFRIQGRIAPWLEWIMVRMDNRLPRVGNSAFLFVCLGLFVCPPPFLCTFEMGDFSLRAWNWRFNGQDKGN